MNKSRQEKWSKVTVIIVNLNGERLLDRCLSSLMAQTVMPHEIILVDNASSDASLEVIWNFPSVHLLAQDHNLGFARGNNVAIEASDSNSEWIALLNPDAFVDPRWLETLLLAAQEYPGFDFFGSKLLDASDPTKLDGAGDAYQLSGRVWREGRGASASYFADQFREIFSPCAAAALYRRSAILKIGGFDEDFFCYVEDIDLGFRLRLAGYRCLYVPASVANHVGSATTGGQHSDFSVYHGHRNLVWTYVKNMPGLFFWLFLPLHLFMNLAAVLACCFRGQGKVALRAKRDAFIFLPEMWVKRQAIQASRIATLNEIFQVMTKSFMQAKK